MFGRDRGLNLMCGTVLNFMLGIDCGFFCAAKCCIVIGSTKGQLAGCTLHPAYTNRRDRVYVDKSFVNTPIS